VLNDLRKIVAETQWRGGSGNGDAEYLSFRDIFSFLRRHALMLLFFGALGAALGAVYVNRTPPTYKAVTRLVMDPEQGRIASQDAATGTIIIEAAEIASQVEIVKSETIARAVIKELDLVHDPEIRDGQSWRSALRESISPLLEYFTGNSSTPAAAVQPSPEDDIRRTMAAFLGRAEVRRVGQSYVLEIGYTSNDPQKAARAANAIAKAYIRSGLNERADAARSGAKWLESRLLEIGEQARKASLELESLRVTNDITSVGSAMSLDQQQLVELSTQVLAARAEVATQSAKLETLLSLRAPGAPMMAVDETIANAQLQKLRDDLRLAVTKLEELRGRYAAGNPAIKSAEAEIARLEADMQLELGRIEGVYRSNLDIARKRENLLQTQLVQLTRSGSEKNKARAELSEMESRASTYRRMYESLLQQLTGALQKQSFPIGTARVVTAATAPLSKTWPKTTIILPFSAVLGFGAGLLFALVRDGTDRRVRSGDRLRRELGLASLGQVPFAGGRWPPRLPVASHGNGEPVRSKRMLRFVLDKPYSPFGEALRGAKASIEAGFKPETPLVIGVTSVGRGEGKTTVAVNLAQLYLNEGTRVVLVDADFQDGRLSRAAASAGDEIALAEMAARSTEPMPAADLEEAPDVPEDGDTAVRKKQKTRKKMQPVSPAEPAGAVPVLTTDMIRREVPDGQRFGHLAVLRSRIAELRQQFPVVIVDLSGFADSADTRSICLNLDGIVVVLGRPDKITLERLADALAGFGKARINLIGVLLNRSRNRRPSAFRRS
jgi:polysaccharide biosynthesis transport protein